MLLAHTHTQPAFVFLFSARKKHHGLSTTYSNMEMERRGFKTMHLEGWGVGGLSSRHEMDREGERGRKREDEGEVEANHSILDAPDRQTDRLAAGGNGFQYDQACQQITQP